MDELYTTTGTGRFYSPFSLTLDPMERLLLINFTSDPDSIYVGFEPQVFADAKHGRGLIVIAYLADNRFDIYHQPGLTLRREDYAIVGKGLRELVERPLIDSRFEVTPTGVDLDIMFDDFAGRPVELRIHERGQKLTRPFVILAPLGNTTDQPPALPLYFLYDFYFVRRRGTELLISVDGRRHQPDSIPMLLDASRVHFLRYSAEPFLASWNEANEGALRPVTAIEPQAGDRGQARDGHVLYDLLLRDGHPEIAVMTIANERKAMRIEFDPPVPDIAGIRDGSDIDGVFTIRGDGATGTVRGSYRLARAGEAIEMKVRPDGGWQPDVDRWSVKLIFRLVPLFKRWPMTYEWAARITLRDGEPPFMQSGWRRLGEEGQGRVIRLFD